MSVLPTFICVYHLQAWYLRRSGEAIGSLELELRVVVSHYVGPGNQTQVLGKNKNSSCLLSLFFSNWSNILSQV